MSEDEKDLIAKLTEVLEEKSQTPQFEWSHLIPKTKFGMTIAVAIVLVLAGGSASDILLIARGALGLPNVVVETQTGTEEQVKRLVDNFEQVQATTDWRIGNVEQDFFDHEKKNDTAILEIQGTLNTHTTQLDTIISMGSGMLNP